MFIRKFLKQNQVDEVNAKGHFIKVMNSESVLRIKATYQGRTVLETDARAGFDVQTGSPFDLIQITSQIEQKLEIWVSEHKLSYDALSVKASRVSSALVGHFGHSQTLMGYDPSQSRILIQSDKEWYIGGENVNSSNGIPIAANERYIHDSAAPIFSFLDEKPVPIYKSDFNAPMVIDIDGFLLGSEAVRKLDERYFYISNLGVFDTVDKKIKQLGTGLVDADEVGHPFVKDGYFYFVFYTLGRGFEVWLGVDDGQSIEFSERVATIEGVTSVDFGVGATQEVRVSDYVNGIMYLVADGNTVSVLDFSAISPIPVGRQIISATNTALDFSDSVVAIFASASQNTVFFACKSKMVVAELNLNITDTFSLVDRVLDCEPSFNSEEGVWLFQSMSAGVVGFSVYSELFGYEPQAPAGWLVASVAGGTAIGYVGDMVSANGAPVYTGFNSAAPKDRPIAALDMADGVYIVELAAGNMLYFAAALTGYKELAQFRVLKESF